MQHFRKKIALVTGASRGLGFHTALQLAQQGALVVATARQKRSLDGLAQELEKLGAPHLLVALELQDANCVKALANLIRSRWGVLDILVANAGILGALSPVESYEISQFEEVIRTNFLGNFFLIQAFADLLKKSAAGRAVFLTSGAANNARPKWSGYGSSKAALNLLVRSWAKENEDKNIKINLVSPGATRTAMRAEAMPQEDPSSLPSPEKISSSFLHLLSENCQITGRIFDCRKNDFTE